MMRTSLILPLLAAASAGSASAHALAADRVFEKDILPLLEKRCSGCHGKDERKGDLELSSAEKLLEGGRGGPVIVPGRSSESRIVDRITRRDSKTMPPPKSGKPLSDAETAAIREWIDGGARAETKEARAAASAAVGSPPAPAAPSPAPRETTGLPGPIASVSFSPDGSLLALGSDRTVVLVSAGDGSEIATLGGPSDLVRALAFSPDGSRLAAAGGAPGQEGEVVLWTGTPGKASAWVEAARIRAHEDAIYAIAFSPDGSMLATSSYDRLVKLWDLAAKGGAPAETGSLKDHLDGVFALAASPDGSRLFSASGDRTLKVWDVSTRKRILTLSDATLGLNTLALAPRTGEVAAAGQDRMIRIWRIEGSAGILARSFFAHEGAVLRIAFSPDGRSLYSAAEDGRIKAWSTESFTERLVFEKQPDWIFDLAVRPDGGALAASRHDGSWAVYDTESGRRLFGSGDAKRERLASGEAADKAAAVAAGATDASPAPPKKKGRDLLVDVVDPGNVTVPPSLGSVSPRAVSRGAKAVFEVNGQNLADCEIAFYEPGFTARVVSNESLPPPEFRRIPGNTGAEIIDKSVPHKLRVEVDVSPEARPGMHALLGLTPRGATNTLSVYVEHLPEAREAEPNDVIDKATPFSAGALAGREVVLGAIDRSGDADLFSFEASEGQEIVFHILSTSLGSGLNGLLAVVGPDGAELSTSSAREFGNRSEARVAHRFSKAGKHYLKVTDRNFGQGFYRLHAGELPFVTSFFPPGLQKGTTAEISVEGYNLGHGMKVKVEAPLETGWGTTVPLPLPGALQGANVAVGEHPEVIESEPNDDPRSAQRIDAPVTVNGVIEGKGEGVDADFFAFQGRKGEELIIDVMASRVGSLLDSVIDIVDPEGRPLERATLRCVAQTFVTLGDRDARSSGLRLDAWSDLRVNDFLFVGTEVLKVRLLPDYPDEDVTFFNAGGARTGYLDTTPEWHAVNDAAYKVEIHPPGMEFPPNGMPVFRVPFRNDDGGMPDHGRDSKLHFTPPADGEYVVRLRDVQGRGAPGFYYRLQVRKARPDFRFFVGVENLNVPRGGRVPFTVSVERLDDMNEPIEVELVDAAPEGFSLDTAGIPADSDEATCTVKALPDARSTPLSGSIRLRARARVAGKEVVREGRLRMLHIAGEPDLVIDMEPREVKLLAGSTSTVSVRASRKNGFIGRVPLDVPNLPHGVVVMDTGLNGILIPEGEDSREYILRAEPWVAPGRFTIYTTGRTETRSPLPTTFSSEPAVLVIEAPPGVAKAPTSEF